MKITTGTPTLVEWLEYTRRDRLRRQTAALLLRPVAPDEVFRPGQRRHLIHPSAQRRNAARIRSPLHDAIDLFRKAGNRFLSTPQRTSKIAAASGASSSACVASTLANICESFPSHGRCNS